MKIVAVGGDLDPLLNGGRPLAERYVAFAIEMPIVPAHEGESLRFPSGELLKADTSSRSHKWYAGLFGPSELLFELKKDKDDWKVVPRDYLTVLGLGAGEGENKLPE